MKNLIKKYQVFVSSTYKDLVEERQKITSVLLKSGCIPAGMELFPAADDDSWSLIKKVIDESDYYVLVIAGKYGSEKNGKSYTQMEYEYALSKKKSIVAFIHDDISSLTGYKLEDDSKKKEKLAEFIRLAKRKHCKYWKTKDELALELYHSINNLKKANKKDGWIRATPYNLRKLSENRNKSLKNKLEVLKRKIEIRESTINRLKSDRSSDILVSEYLDQKMKEFDRRANELYPGKFYLPAKDSYEEFSCRKLISSLSSVGIPIEACFEIVENVIIDLQKSKGHVSQISTTHIREYISHALYSYSRKEEEFPCDWEDKYIRKYGNPDRRITVIEDSGNVIPLTFKYIKRNLLPEVFESIIDGLDSRKFLQTLRHNERSVSAKAILDTVKLIEMEQIDHNTLLSMSKTMVLRQPHPWISKRSFDENCIRYDLCRANVHFGQIKKCFASECKVETSTHSIREFIHHVCSGILTIYGAYKGSQFMAPLDYLINNLKKIDSDKGSYLFQYSSFKSITHDLDDLGTDTNELIAAAKGIKIFVKNSDLRGLDDSDFDKSLVYLNKVLVGLVSIYMPELAKIVE